MFTDPATLGLSLRTGGGTDSDSDNDSVPAAKESATSTAGTPCTAFAKPTTQEAFAAPKASTTFETVAVAPKAGIVPKASTDNMVKSPWSLVQHPIVATACYSVLGSTYSGTANKDVKKTVSVEPRKIGSFGTNVPRVANETRKAALAVDPVAVELALQTLESATVPAMVLPSETKVETAVNAPTSEPTPQLSKPTEIQSENPKKKQTAQKSKTQASPPTKAVAAIQGPSTDLATTDTKYCRILANANATAPPVEPTALAPKSNKSWSVDPLAVAPKQPASELEYGHVAFVNAVVMANAALVENKDKPPAAKKKQNRRGGHKSMAVPAVASPEPPKAPSKSWACIAATKPVEKPKLVVAVKAVAVPKPVTVAVAPVQAKNEPEPSPAADSPVKKPTENTAEANKENAPQPATTRKLACANTSNQFNGTGESKMRSFPSANPKSKGALSSKTPLGDSKWTPVPTKSKAIAADSIKTKPRLLILCSTQSMHREVATKQKKAYAVLTTMGLNYETIDGADMANKVTRDNLFTVSGLGAQYPQFFLVQGEELSFWGDWDHFELATEMGSLTNDLLGMSVSNDIVIAFKPALEKSAASKAAYRADGNTLLVLCSNQSLDRKVAAKQERAYTVLASQGIEYKTLDGADPSNKARRNELFDVSGIRAKYPQFFITKPAGQTAFWGDWERFETANETGTLAQEVTAAVEGPSARSTGKEQGDLITGEKPPRAPVGDKGAASEKKGSHNVTAGGTKRAVGTKRVDRSVETDITVYGATGFVAKHILTYLMQTSVHLGQELKVTLAGRTPSKVESIRSEFSVIMSNLRTITSDATGFCTFDTFTADSVDAKALQKMAKRTRVVLNCAGPFTKCGSNVVLACALTGADYVDITGEISWAGEMRAKHSSKAKASGARIISFCGFDSIPSDLAVHTAVEALRSKIGTVEIEKATTWHNVFGGANGGTIQTALDMPVDVMNCLKQPFPFLVDDPLVLAHPSVRADPASQAMRKRLAKAEWLNQLPWFETIVRLGVSIPFVMAVANAKVVHASAIALKYGPNFVYRERYFPTGFRMTAQLGTVSLFPAILTMMGLALTFVILKLPVIGQAIVDRLLPPGTGMSDQMCKAGYAEVYAEVVGPKDPITGYVDKANCFIAFSGDPGNWATAQCVGESALVLVLNREDLPLRSEDGFGTPAELLGGVLLTRLTESKVRPVVVETSVRKKTVRNDWKMYP